MTSLAAYFDQFVQERTYLSNVTPRTREWYQTAWKAFVRAQQAAPPRSESASLITRRDLQHFVVHMRERNVKPVSCNCWLRAMNAFCKWLHEQGVTPELVRLRPQKLEKRVIRVHDDAALRRLVTFRPTTFAKWRIYAVACAIIDTGCRINELLAVPARDFDLDKLLLTVDGKGRKERRVPFSVELRRVLFRFGQVKERAGMTSDLMFPARDGGKWQHRNARRSYHALLRGLGLRQSGFHLLRHTFATQYLRHGGDVVRLSIILGHTEVSTTMKYLHLLTEDLQRPHQSLSILNRLR